MPQIAQQDYIVLPFLDSDGALKELSSSEKKQLQDIALRGCLADVIFTGMNGHSAKIMAWQFQTDSDDTGFWFDVFWIAIFTGNQDSPIQVYDLK